MNNIKDEGKELDLVNEPFVRKLIKNSFFTRNQIITLLDYIYKKRSGLKIKSESNKVNIRNKEVSRITYYKIIRYTKEKIAKTIISLLLLISLNIISQDQLYDLLEITSQTFDEDVIDRIIKKIKLGL